MAWTPPEPVRRALGAVAAVWHHRIIGVPLRLGVAWIVVAEVVLQGVFGRIDIPFADVSWLEVGTRGAPIPRDVFAVGAIVGVLYALMGMGLILVHRANRIINFAQAQLGAVPAIAALLLMVRQGLPYLLAVPLAVAGGAALGAGVEVTVVRRFRESSRLVLTVATVGISLLLLVLEFVVKRAITGDLLVVDTIRSPLSDLGFNLGAARISGDHMLTVVVAVALLGGLVVFFQSTRIGMAIRAAAENRDRAMLLGIPVDRVSTVVWTLAGALSAVGVFLRAPIVGLPLAGFIGPFFLLYGLAVAVIARMDRLPTALAAGMFIGMADQAAVFATRRSSLATASMLVVILGALLLQRRHLARTEMDAGGSWDAVREPQPILPHLRVLPRVAAFRWLSLTLAVGFAFALPWIVGPVRVPFATTGIVIAMVGISLVILTGWSGQISLGQFAFVGIGAAVAGGLSANHNWDLFATLGAAAAAGALAAVLVGLPAIRLPGLYLAVTTLAFAFTVQEFVLRADYFGWLLPGGLGFVERPVVYGVVDLGSDSTWGGVLFAAPTKLYLLGLVLLGIVVGVARSLRTYRSGRILIGMRDNPRLLQAFGASPTATRLSAFAVAGAIAGLAGGFFVYTQGAVDAATFTPAKSVEIFVVTVLGGIGSITGAILGALFLQSFSLFGIRNIPVWGDTIALLGTSVGVLLVLYVSPGGLIEVVSGVRDRIVTALVGASAPEPDGDRDEEAAIFALDGLDADAGDGVAAVSLVGSEGQPS